MFRLVRYKRVRVEGAVAIAGFPGMGYVGKTVVESLISKLHAEHIASIYSTGFPSHLMVDDGGLANLIAINIYFAHADGKPLILVSSDVQPHEDIEQNKLSFVIAKFLKKIGVREIITGAAFVTEPIVESRRVFVAATNRETVRKFVEHGAVPLQEGVISGMNGVLIGWGKVLGMDGACVLGETWRSIVELNYVDYGAAKSVLEVLSRVLGISIDLTDLEEKARVVEERIRKIMERSVQLPETKESERSFYIT